MQQLLTDVAGQVWSENFSINSTDVPSQTSSAWSITKSTLRGGRSDGVDLVELNNGRMKISVLPTRGMGIWKAEIDGVRIGWDSPVEQPVNPAFVDLNDRNGLGWLSGFNELLCRCGMGWNGPPGDDDGRLLTLHGRVANTPAHRVEVGLGDDGGVYVSGEVDETMMFDSRLRLSTTVFSAFDSNALTVVDEVTNRGGQTVEMQMLYHWNIGTPFPDSGGRFFAAFEEVAPRDPRAAEGAASWSEIGEAKAGYAEQVYYLKPNASSSHSRVLLRNRAGDQGVELAFNPGELPAFSLWKNTQAESDGAVVGLEPATNYPNFRAYEREHGRVIRLEPGETWESRQTLAVHLSADSVERIEKLISAAHDESSATTHISPVKGLSPA